MVKKITQFKLKYLAKIILKKYQPKVIGITGSVGKTSTREAIFSVLRTKFRARRSEKNYNNELGLPLTIIGAASPKKNFFGWLGVFFKALFLILFKNKDYPEILILEMGVDRPGDMDYLNKIVTCDIGVITLIGPTHLESFGSIERIKREKGKLIKNLEKNGWAVINFDDAKSREIAGNLKVKVLKYGFENGADVRAENLIFKFEETRNLNNLLGSSFKLNYDGGVVPVVLPKVIGVAAIYSSLAAASVGIALGMNLVEIADALKDFDSPPGRMKLIPGIKHALIIDDTYNSSPQSAASAIGFIEKIKTERPFRKIAVLGDMLELGNYSVEGHREVGRALTESNFDLLITVGERARDIGRGAKEAGMSEEQVFYFSENEEAGKFVQQRMHEGDLVLVKGSQGARMEKIVKEIMAEPLRAEKLLARQESEWLT